MKFIHKETEKPSYCTIVFGSQYGDESKGKIVDIFAKKYEEKGVVYVVRFNGGSNAGHSIYINGVLYDTHIIPSGILNEKCINVIGCGTVINVIQFFDEYEKLKQKGINPENKIIISDSSHVTLLIHKFIDSIEGKEFGSTGSGISQTIADKANRRGIAMFELTSNTWKEQIKKVYDYHKNIYSLYLKHIEEFTVKYLGTKVSFKTFDEMYNYEIAFIENKLDELRKMIKNTKIILNSLNPDVPIIFEGANSIMLDQNVGYPNCTATSCTIGSVMSGSGVSIKFLQERNFKVIGVMKGYITRVGTGNLVTEDFSKDGEILQTVGKEFGTTTGRKRRTGWFDIPLVRYTNKLTGFDFINITKLDVLSSFDNVKVCTGYKNKKTGEILTERTFYEAISDEFEPIYIEMDGWKDFDFAKCKKFDDLHDNVKKFISYLEDQIGVPIMFINTGRERDQFIIC